jgi:hypothetical protein
MQMPWSYQPLPTRILLEVAIELLAYDTQDLRHWPTRQSCDVRALSFRFPHSLAVTFTACDSATTACELSFFLIWIVGGGIKLHSTVRPLNGLLYQPRVIMIMEKSVEWWSGETEVLGENLPQCRFVHHKPHMLPAREPGPPRWEASV